MTMTVIDPAPSAAGPRRAPVRAVAVIIPAHDEQELLGACLDALEPAVRHAREAGLLRVLTIVIADACTDSTRATARARATVCLTANGRNVGAARALGTAHALAELAREGHDPAQVYLLHTDADTLVPTDWITRHVRAATRHDAVLGPVEVRDWTGRAEDCADRFAHAAALEPDEDRVHGANLGVRADAYLRVGGFPALPVAEDRAIVETLRTAGESVVFHGDLAVCTSARVSRRVHGGFSDYLSKLEDRVPAQTTDTVVAGAD
jgi:glycosyltransferase involved in cell wall biosynthesis